MDDIQKENNYPGVSKLIKLVQEAHPEIKRKEIVEFIAQDTMRQQTKIQHKKKATGHMTSLVPNELWNVDLFDLSRYHKSNNG